MEEDFDWDDEEEEEEEAGGDDDEDEEDKPKKKSKPVRAKKEKSSSTARSSSSSGMSSRDRLLKASKLTASTSSVPKKTSAVSNTKQNFPKPPMLHMLAIPTTGQSSVPPLPPPLHTQGDALRGNCPNSLQKTPAPPTSSPNQRRHITGALDTLGQDTAVWASIILRDEQLQNLVRKYLASRLVELCENRILPIDDENSKNALEICQYGLQYQKRVVENADGVLVRVILPLLLLVYVDKKSLASLKDDDRSVPKEDTSLDEIIPQDVLNFDRSLLRKFVEETLDVMLQSSERQGSRKGQK